MKPANFKILYYQNCLSGTTRAFLSFKNNTLQSVEVVKVAMNDTSFTETLNFKAGC